MGTIEDERRYETGVWPRRELALERGDGEFVWDESGKRYVDFFNGPAVNILGYGNHEVADAIGRQYRKLSNCYGMFYNQERAKLCGQLANISPGGLERTFLCSSGSEAVEAALKFARAGGRKEVISTMGAYHGKTYGSLGVTWNRKYSQFGPFPNVKHVRYGDADAIGDAIAENTCAVIVEPIQGENGVRIPPEGYLREVREVTQEKSILMIVDEIQTGLGRTGRMFACEWEKVEPDIMVVGKGLAGGIPIGAMVARPEVCTLPKKAHTTTFGGNPVACAAGNTVLSIIEREGLVKRAEEFGARLLEGLKGIDSKKIREVRGRGLMAAVELKEEVGPLVKELQNRGIIVGASGRTTIRFLPALTISEESIDALCGALQEAL